MGYVMVGYLLTAAVGLFAVCMVAVFVLMITNDIKNAKRMNCRCCGGDLKKPGGAGLVWLGPGFCERCAAAILRPRSLK